MRTRELWRGGPVVGAVGLGCMGMSWAYSPAEQDDDRSVAVIHRAVDLGVTLIDTADVYGPFHNEELVGRALRELAPQARERVTLATKAGLVAPDSEPGSVRRDGRPEHIKAACEASLGRLGVEVIDLYQLHRVDEKVPLADTWGAMAELVAAGHVRAIGMSEVTVEQLDEAQAIHPVSTVQSEMSLWTRGPLADVLPWCAAHGAGFIPFAPLGRGFLTGTLKPGSFDDDDLRAHNPRFADAAMQANEAILVAVRAVADRNDATPAQVALAWDVAQGDRVVPIPGTKRLERIAENAGAADLELSAEALESLDRLPDPVGSRY